MRIFRKIPEADDIFKSSVITIGSFDGVHTGHRKIFSVLSDIAKREAGEAIVITFDVHPRKVLTPHTPPRILTSEAEKVNAIADTGIENIILLSFTSKLGNMSAEDFITEIIKKINIIEIVAGYDHAFGKNREGDIDFLKGFCISRGIKISRVEPEKYCHKPISSTWIRSEIEAGNISLSNLLLGRQYTLLGNVVRGKERGRQLGFPTANILPEDPDKVIPKDGVYAVTVVVDGRLEMQGMLNIGTNPTFANIERTIEVNIFEFNEDLYGLDIELRFHERIRDEMRFDSINELVEQLKKDKITATKLLN
ncbi:MAG: bifunctional riboflavin kinase/FAD synthetase [Spirochaetota bacterium]|nr:bifunctional riboflavin kinase/FAD synthetase [Spirochaetota bacterium]